MLHRLATFALPAVLALLSHAAEPDSHSLRGAPGARQPNLPPPNAAAYFEPNAGQCIQYISVFVPSHGGDYVVGLSFAYRDLDRDGKYTPGIDRLEVCVNCADACGFGP